MEIGAPQWCLPALKQAKRLQLKQALTTRGQFFQAFATKNSHNIGPITVPSSMWTSKLVL
jgi:hypothetical protein